MESVGSGTMLVLSTGKEDDVSASSVKSRTFLKVLSGLMYDWSGASSEGAELAKEAATAGATVTVAPGECFKITSESSFVACASKA